MVLLYLHLVVTYAQVLDTRKTKNIQEHWTKYSWYENEHRAKWVDLKGRRYSRQGEYFLRKQQRKAKFYCHRKSKYRIYFKVVYNKLQIKMKTLESFNDITVIISSWVRPKLRHDILVIMVWNELDFYVLLMTNYLNRNVR